MHQVTATIRYIIVPVLHIEPITIKPTWCLLNDPEPAVSNMKVSVAIMAAIAVALSFEQKQHTVSATRPLTTGTILYKHT